MIPRRAATAAIAVLTTDLLVILVTGSHSIFDVRVDLAGFVLRAITLGLSVLLRCHVWAEPERRMDPGRIVLLMLLLPTLVQFQFAGGRINGDGLMYYPYVRSIWKDFDVDLANEYTHYGLITRSDLAVPTKTGHRRSIFSIGPAVVWSPFFLLGESVARLEGLLGREVDLSGYGPHHRNAVALGSLLYGFAAVLLIHALLRRHFSGGTALGSALLVWGATFLHWYMVQQPTTSHAPSAFAAAWALWLWDRDREARDPARFLRLGLVLGLAMCIRWQNGLLLVLPGLDLIVRFFRNSPARPRLLGLAAALAAGTLLGAASQMLAWKALYDMWLLPYPPHGADFVRLDHPFVLETLFSSRHGLLSWTPVFWAGYLGFGLFLRREPALGFPLLVPLVLMTYVNLCSGDWWAGGSFSNRRFDSLLPILAFGFAMSIDGLGWMLRHAPGTALAAVAALLVVWNGVLMEQVRRGLVPRDDTVAFPRLVGGGASVFADALGSPTTWPASWIFALRNQRPPGQYDLLVGQYLFYRQNNLGGHIGVGEAGAAPLLAEGWGPPESHEGTPARRVRGRARLFAPLDVPEPLEIRFRAAAASGPAEIRVLVNGRDAGRFWAENAWRDSPVRVAAAFWRRELNDVILDAGSASLFIASADFSRAPRE